MNEEQELLLEMYKDTARILDEHGIRFFIHYGTAIGALRHDGFIPWDNDIDIVVWAEDLEKVNKVLSEELDSEKYFYHIPLADTHPHVIRRTADFAEAMKEKRARFIDVFVLDRYPEKWIRRRLVNSMVWAEVLWVVFIDRFVPLFMHRLLSKIPRWFERRARGLTKPDTSLTTVYSTTFKDDIFPSEYFEELFMHRFEDTEVPLPKGIDKALTSLFGDYMTPPPEDKRHGANGFPCSGYKDYVLYEKFKKD